MLAPKWIQNSNRWEEGPEPLRAKVHVGGGKYRFGWVLPDCSTALITERGVIIGDIPKGEITLAVDGEL